MTAPSRYQELLAKVDAKSEEFQQIYAEQLHCRKGCSSCCLPGLSVFSVERQAIKSWLESKPALLEQLQHESLADQGGSCAFLDKEGSCRIYPVRPIICRTQGLPLSFKRAERTQRDVCPLNFEGIDLHTLAVDGVLNLDLLNTLLVLVDQVEGGDAAGQRFGLNASAIIGD